MVYNRYLLRVCCCCVDVYRVPGIRACKGCGLVWVILWVAGLSSSCVALREPGRVNTSGLWHYATQTCSFTDSASGIDDASITHDFRRLFSILYPRRICPYFYLRSSYERSMIMLLLSIAPC